MEKGQTPPGGEWEKTQGEFRLVEIIIPTQNRLIWKLCPRRFRDSKVTSSSRPFLLRAFNFKL